MTDILDTAKAALAEWDKDLPGQDWYRAGASAHVATFNGDKTVRWIDVSWDQIRALVAEVERLREVESDFASFQEHHAATERDLAALRQRHADTQAAIVEYANLRISLRKLGEVADVYVLNAPACDTDDGLNFLRQRHAEAVEAAYREAVARFGNEYIDGYPPEPEDVDAAWLASEAKARLT